MVSKTVEVKMYKEFICPAGMLVAEMKSSQAVQ